MRYAKGLHHITRTGLRLPDKVLEILNKVAVGKATIQLETLHLKEIMADLKKSINRIVFALIVSALIMGSSLVVNSEAGPKLMSIPILGLLGYVGAAIMGMWLLISILRSGRI
jgi:ubiquinone biosynthesis protein